jgi:hypothetical protein
MSELLIPAVAIGAVLLAWLVWRGWRNSRGSQLRRIARTLGLERAPERAAIEGAEPLRRPPLQAEHAHATSAWRGELLGAELWAIELQRGHAAPDPVVLLRCATDPLPAFELLPHGSAAGEPGVRFAESRRFAELFALRGADEEAIRRVFRDEVLGFFERAENLSWVLIATGDWLAIAVAPLGERRHKLDPKHFAGFVEDAKVLYRVLRGAPPRPRVGRGSHETRVASPPQAG